MKYQCTGMSKTTFSTISDAYFKKNKRDGIMFPYIRTAKTGVSRDLFELVHDGIMSARGTVLRKSIHYCRN